MPKGETMKRRLLLVLAIYLVGVVVSLSIDWYQYWSAGGGGGFALADSLAFASYWPLRAYWHLV